MLQVVPYSIKVRQWLSLPDLCVHRGGKRVIKGCIDFLRQPLIDLIVPVTSPSYIYLAIFIIASPCILYLIYFARWLHQEGQE